MKLYDPKKKPAKVVTIFNMQWITVEKENKRLNTKIK